MANFDLSPLLTEIKDQDPIYEVLYDFAEKLRKGLDGRIEVDIREYRPNPKNRGEIMKFNEFVEWTTKNPKTLRFIVTSFYKGKGNPTVELFKVSYNWNNNVINNGVFYTFGEKDEQKEVNFSSLDHLIEIINQELKDNKNWKTIFLSLL